MQFEGGIQKKMKRFLALSFIAFYMTSAIPQGLREQYSRSENIRQQQQIEADKRTQDELNAISAASKFGAVFYCKDGWKTKVFHNGRLFFNSSQHDYSQLKGTFFEEKMHYKVKGDWISYKARDTEDELNQVTGDTYQKYLPNGRVNETIANCKRVR